MLDALTLGGYGTYELGRAMWAGYNDDGVLGAINAVNPFYAIVAGTQGTVRAAQAGDYRAAGAAGVKVAVLGAAMVYGAGDGAGALVEEGAAGAAAEAETLAGEVAAAEQTAGGAASGLGDLAQFRAEVGLKPGEGTLARLDVGGRKFYGINAHGQNYPRPSGVTFQSLRHAEGDVFGQAARSGIRGGNGMLHVDRAICGWCASSLTGYARQLGFERLTVIMPGKTIMVIP